MAAAHPGAGHASRGPAGEPGGRAGALLSGRYRLEQRIAAGGMGEVWRATDEVLGRPVAVKLLRHAYIGDEALASRFRAEARYAAALSHPGIAQVFDYGEQHVPGDGSGHGGGAYLVLELVPGEPLSAILARSGPLPAKATLDIVAQAANALAAAHASGIVHRDIKPGNLLVTADGRVKITDFGIARAAQAAQAGHLTQTGMVMGTAQYVSPEQASGLAVTHSSDIYSLGVVAYECLAGRPPFAADALIAVALAHVHEVPPPLPPSAPAMVSDMVMRMLAKRTEDRPGSARAVADRATLLRDTLRVSPGAGLAGIACGDAGGWLSAGSPATSASHDGTTSQLPINAPERLPHGSRPHPQRRALVVAALSVALLGVGGVGAGLMVDGHHATPVGSRSKPSATLPPSHPTTAPASSSPAAPAVVPPSPAVTPSETPSPAPTASASASPTPTVSASASPTPTATATQPPTSPPATATQSATSPTATATQPPTSPSPSTATVSPPANPSNS